MIARVTLDSPSDDLGFSPDGMRAYITLGRANAVAVVDAATHKVLNTIAVGKVPHGVRAGPDGKHVYVTNTKDNTVSVMDPDRDTVVATIPVGTNPYEVGVLPTGDAYVTNFLESTVSVIRNGQVASKVPVGQQPSMIAVSSDGRRVYTGNSGSGDVSVVDTRQGKQARRIPASRRAHGVVVHDGKLYVTNTADSTLSVIEEATGRQVTKVPVGNSPNGVAIRSAQGEG